MAVIFIFIFFCLVVLLLYIDWSTSLVFFSIYSFTNKKNWVYMPCQYMLRFWSVSLSLSSISRSIIRMYEVLSCSLIHLKWDNIRKWWFLIYNAVWLIWKELRELSSTLIQLTYWSNMPLQYTKNVVEAQPSRSSQALEIWCPLLGGPC